MKFGKIQALVKLLRFCDADFRINLDWLNSNAGFFSIFWQFFCQFEKTIIPLEGRNGEESEMGK